MQVLQAAFSEAMMPVQFMPPVAVVVTPPDIVEVLDGPVAVTLGLELGPDVVSGSSSHPQNIPTTSAPEIITAGSRFRMSSPRKRKEPYPDHRIEIGPPMGSKFRISPRRRIRNPDRNQVQWPSRRAA